MALSNIFREPRREITESVIGILAVVPFGYLDYRLASAWVATSKNAPPFPLALIVIGLGFLIALIASVVFMLLTHEFGDWICNQLQTAGLHLRPRNRR